MNDLLLWNFAREAWNALAPYYEPVIHQISNETGLQTRAWGLLLAVLTFEPERTTPSHLMIRGPYTSAEKYLKRLRSLARLEFMNEDEESKFSLTEMGRSETLRFIESVRAAMTAADPLSSTDSLRLAVLLDQLVRACRETPPPPDTWSIDLSDKLMPDPEPPLPYIEQAFSCLAAYRDDAHLAAWQDTGLPATTLEALTLFWRGEADSLSSLIEKLEPRGHEVKIYESAVEELREGNFVTGDNSALQVSSTGRQFRDAIEDQTDRFFFKPWKMMSEAEKQELEGLLTDLRDGLRAGSPG